jgi:hypothetical protein
MTTVVVKDGKKAGLFILKFYRNIGALVGENDNITNHLAHTFTYPVMARSKEDAIKTFLLQDKSGSILGIELGSKDFEDNYPSLYQIQQVQELINLIIDNELDDIDPEEDDEQYKIYADFIENNLGLITDVLLVLDKNTSMFSIEASSLII